MKRTKNRLALCIGLLIGLLAFIWGNSAMPGQTSGELSGWVGAFLQSVFPFLALDSEAGMHILRKLAHFSEFCALGICFAWLFGMLLKKRGLQLLLPLCCGIGAACIDETIQIFSPGRYSSIVDVGIDSCGVLTGVLLLTLAYGIYKKVAVTN